MSRKYNTVRLKIDFHKLEMYLLEIGKKRKTVGEENWKKTPLLEELGFGTRGARYYPDKKRGSFAPERIDKLRESRLPIDDFIIND